MQMYTHLDRMVRKGKQVGEPMTQQELFIEDAKVFAIMTLKPNAGFRQILISQRKAEGIELTDDEAIDEAKAIVKQMIDMAEIIPTRSQCRTKEYKQAKIYKAKFKDELKQILGESFHEYF
jgi:hypothetical protein